MKKQICSVADVEQGNVIRLDVDGMPPLAIYNLDGHIYVTNDTCTHGEASLADGELDGFVIECPFHFGGFDIRTGDPAGAPCTVPLRTYPVTVEEGQVFVDF